MADMFVSDGTIRVAEAVRVARVRTGDVEGDAS